MSTFKVGEQPTQPLVLTVKRDGTPVDLSQYQTVTFDGDLPFGSTEVLTQTGGNVGKIMRVFSEPFEESGIKRFRVAMSNGGAGGPDYSDWVYITVESNLGYSSLIDTNDASSYTGTEVSDSDIMKAVVLCGIYIDRDLTDQTWLAKLSTRNLDRLRKGVAWEAANQRKGGGDVEIPAGAVSVSAPGVSITLGSGGVPLLSTIAQRCLDSLSWRTRNYVPLAPGTYRGGWQQDLVNDGCESDWRPL